MKTYDCSIRPILELHSLLTFKEVSFQDVEATFLQKKMYDTYESSLYFYSNFLHQWSTTVLIFKAGIKDILKGSKILYKD